MPTIKVLSAIPGWLADGSAVQSLFLNSPKSADGTIPSVGPKRTVALRDTQAFVAVDKEIRCAELKQLKKESENGSEIDYKVLDLPALDFEVQQLEMSADCCAMALAGESRLGVCLLPSPDAIKGAGARLHSQYFEIGKNDLVKSGRKIIRVLWHPMGAALCLVVVTDDSLIRMYELEVNLDGSGDIADQTLDLNKMANGGQVGFSMDDDIQPTSACFADSISVWSSFALHILTSGGDIYSVCPLVPARWMGDPEFMEELQYELSSLANTGADEEIPQTPLERYNIRQQTLWIEDAFRLQRVMKMSSSKRDTSKSDVFLRPEHQDLNTPLLQGPYLIQPAPREKCNGDVYASDIIHIAAESFAVFAVLYSNGEVDTFVEYEAVNPRWEVKTLKHKKHNDRSPYPVLSGLETINLKLKLSPQASSEHWPLFSLDKSWTGRLLVNHSQGIEVVCIEDWITGITKLIDEEDDPTILKKALQKMPGSQIAHAINPQKNAHGAANSVLGSAILFDAYLGYIVVSQRVSNPGFAVLEIPSRFKNRLEAEMLEDPVTTSTPEKKQKLEETPRQANPPVDLELLKSQKYKDAISSLRRESPETWQRKVLLSPMHKGILDDLRMLFTIEIGIRQRKAQEIVERAFDQRDAFLDQLEAFQQAAETAKRVQLERDEQLEKLKQAKEKQVELQARTLALLSKLAATSKSVGYKGYSDAEGKWFAELKGMKDLVVGVKQKQKEMQKFIDDVSENELKQPKLITEAEEGFTRSLRLEKTGDLDMLVSKEHAMIEKLSSKLSSLELSYQTLE